MTENDIIKAYVRMREIDNTIPDEVLDFMKDASIEKLNKPFNSKKYDKKKLIEELLDCVVDATDIETQITSISIAGILMNEVLDETLSEPVVTKTS